MSSYITADDVLLLRAVLLRSVGGGVCGCVGGGGKKGRSVLCVCPRYGVAPLDREGWRRGVDGGGGCGLDALTWRLTWRDITQRAAGGEGPAKVQPPPASRRQPFWPRRSRPMEATHRAPRRRLHRLQQRPKRPPGVLPRCRCSEYGDFEISIFCAGWTRFEGPDSTRTLKRVPSHAKRFEFRRLVEP